MELKFATSSFATETSTSQTIFSSNDTLVDPNWHFSFNFGGMVNENNCYGWKYYGKTYSKVTQAASLKLNTDYTIKTSGDRWLINGIEFASSGSNTMTAGKVAPITLKLFAAVSNGVIKPFDPGNLKIYYFKILDGDKVIANLVPAYRESDNVAGMYDTVNNAFYTNAGTGKFNIGEDI